VHSNTYILVWLKNLTLQIDISFNNDIHYIILMRYITKRKKLDQCPQMNKFKSMGLKSTVTDNGNVGVTKAFIEIKRQET
jgi:hypothetical protein